MEGGAGPATRRLLKRRAWAPPWRVPRVVVRALLPTKIWKFPNIRGPNIDTRIVGLL